jgi:hypothetical protein
LTPKSLLENASGQHRLIMNSSYMNNILPAKKEIFKEQQNNQEMRMLATYKW